MNITFLLISNYTKFNLNLIRFKLITMIITTLGSEYWPKTAEGRVLCILLAFMRLQYLDTLQQHCNLLSVGMRKINSRIQTNSITKQTNS